MPSAIDKYLANYAEPQVETLPQSTIPWEASVVVPFLNEQEFIDPCLKSLAAAALHSNSRIIIIIVVNAREDHPMAVRTAHADWMDAFDTNLYSHLDFCLLNRSSEPHLFHRKQGVGLARKIGCDLALQLWRRGQVIQPVLRTTDADARVPLDYFVSPTTVHRLGGWSEGLPSAYTYPYRHRIDLSYPREGLALTLYEIHLRYYESGLRSAGSLYAFPSMGSTLAIPTPAYAEVRGFPKRNAAEDFYLLNKLAHLGPVYQIDSAPIELEQRRSDRVPFGTGRSTMELADRQNLIENFTLYDPTCFEGLSQCLGSLNQLSHHRDLSRFQSELRSQGAWLGETLEKMGLYAAITHALKTRKEPSSLNRHLHDWFDALKTLQLIRSRPSIPWRTALNDGRHPSEILESLRKVAMNRPHCEPPSLANYKR